MSFPVNGYYSLIWWFRSESTELLIADCTSLASALKFPAQKWESEEALIRDIHDYFARSGNWLLVFDNASSAQSVSQFLPDKGHGHIILTSRNPNWGSVAKQLEIDALSVEDAVSFLLNRTGLNGPNEARYLAQELGCLPLALEQAAAYVVVKNKSLLEYLALYRKHRPRVLQKKDSARDYPDSVAKTWEVSFSEIHEASVSAEEMLNLFAFLCPDGIPRGIVDTGSPDVLLPELAEAVRDEIELDDAVALLRSYSLINFTRNGFKIHRLVQAVIRDALGDDESVSYAQTAQRLILSEMRRSSSNRHDEYMYELISNAFSVEIHAKKFWNRVRYPADLYEKIGYFKLSRFRESEAHKFMIYAINRLRPDLKGKAVGVGLFPTAGAFFLAAGYSLGETAEWMFGKGPDGSVRRKDEFKEAGLMALLASHVEVQRPARNQAPQPGGEDAPGCLLSMLHLLLFQAGLLLAAACLIVIFGLIFGAK